MDEDKCVAAMCHNIGKPSNLWLSDTRYTCLFHDFVCEVRKQTKLSADSLRPFQQWAEYKEMQANDCDENCARSIGVEGGTMMGECLSGLLPDCISYS